MGGEFFVVACSACNAEGADKVTPIGCAACGAMYEPQVDSSDSSSDYSSSEEDGDEVFEIGECHSCGVKGDEYIEGKFCKMCGGRADGCDFCKACNNEGCDACRSTSPAERLKAYREGAMIGCKTCNNEKKQGHLCYGKNCPVCQLRAKESSPTPVETKIGTKISLVEESDSAVMVSDPLASIPPPVFMLNPWGMFIFNADGSFPYSLIQNGAEGDWQFPPAAKAVNVLSMLQRSRMGTEYALLVMNRLCLFLLYAPRMKPRLAPRAVELTHRIMEAILPDNLTPVSAPYTNDEVAWVLAGEGVSFREIEEPRLWTFIYEMIVGLITADEKAALMYRTIMSYSPLMSLVEAKKYCESVEKRDPYASISVHFPGQ